MTTPRKKRPPPAPVSTRRDPWERQPNESDPAWGAFATYRDMGPTRSNAKTAQALGKSKALMDGWSSKHSWVIRATAYDVQVDREWLLEQRELRRKAAQRNATAAGLAMQKFSEFVIALDPEKVTAGDIARIATIAHTIERQALGDSDLNVNVKTDTGAADPKTLAGMSDEDRRARLHMLLREAETRLSEHEGYDPEEESA